MNDSSRAQWIVVAISLCCLLSWPLAAQTPEASSGPEAAPSSWLGPEGKPLPLEGQDAVLNLLRRGRVLSEQVLEGGSNRSIKVRLEHKRIEAHAIFRQVDIHLKRVKVDGKLQRNFRDSHVFECAAYELSRMLGIDNVPPCVLRRLGGRDGSLQLWIEQAMTEENRRAKKLPPQVPMHWAREKQTLRLFDSLIANIDRNQGNMLIDHRGKLWFIDHTRSFGVSREAASLEKIVWCDERVWQGLQSMTLESLEARLPPSVDKERLKALMLRRDQIVDHLQARMQSLGAASVLFDLDNPIKDPMVPVTADEEDDYPVDTGLPDLGN